MFIFLHIFSKGNKIVSVWGSVSPNVYVLYSYNSITRDILREMNNPYVVAILITDSTQRGSQFWKRNAIQRSWSKQN